MSFKFFIGAVTLLALTGLRTTVAQSRCFNPNRRNGVCISIYDCPTLVNLLQKKPLPDQDRNFLVQSRCTGGSGRQPYVCCNEDTGFVTAKPPTTPPTRPPNSEVTIYPSSGMGTVLPAPTKCGREPPGNKIYNGRDTGIDQFAWMVLLEYRDGTGKKIVNCAGSLINSRYVLTAAHCVKGTILSDIGPLVSVRLGEYNIASEEDCVENDCADPIVISEIEEVIPHENFVSSDDSRHNDIALIRLNRDVSMTDFIQPVCLPFVVNSVKTEPGIDLTVAGWGRTLLNRQSSIKQRLEIPVVDQNSCAQKYVAKKVQLIESQLCAGGKYAEDSCDGDSGGPLMKLHPNNYWILEGIVSFGYRCGLEGWPAVYTRVSNYESWIKSKLKP